MSCFIIIVILNVVMLNVVMQSVAMTHKLPLPAKESTIFTAQANASFTDGKCLEPEFDFFHLEIGTKGD